VVFLLAAFAAGPSTVAAQGSGQQGQVPAETTMVLEEVEVIGIKLFQMQRELVKAQDRFFERYNTLNANDDFDIHCSDRAATGTGIRARDCRVEFVQNATAAEGQELFLALTGERPASRAVTTPTILWFQRREEYRENVRALLEASPELQELALKWQNLQAQYDKARRERHKDRAILFQ
jgi:hypothetical protein